MRTNNLTDTAKIFILVTTVVIVCVLCAQGFKLLNGGKSSINSNSNKFIEMTANYSDMNLSLYEGSIIPGSEVTSIIKKAIDEDEYFAIEVQTANGDYATYNYVYVNDDKGPILNDKGPQGQEPRREVPVKKHDYGYINPMAMFLGSTYKDSNDNIIYIQFVQQP